MRFIYTLSISFILSMFILSFAWAADVNCLQQSADSIRSVRLVHKGADHYAMTVEKKTGSNYSRETSQAMPCHQMKIEGTSFLGARCNFMEYIEIHFERNSDTGLFSVYQTININGRPELVQSYGSQMACVVK